MLIIPAVDIRGGQCVRWVHGDPAHQTIYSQNPLEMARRWFTLGAQRLHVVDLDSAVGLGSNLDVALAIKREVGCPVQLGGGIRNREILERVLDAGVERVILGTAVLREPAWVKEVVAQYGERLVASVDSKDGEVRLSGWREGSGVSIQEVLPQVEDMGFREVIFTDISRDGTLRGPALNQISRLLRLTKMRFYCAGGIGALKDIVALQGLSSEGLTGCILGKALYDGRVDFAEALRAAG